MAAESQARLAVSGGLRNTPRTTPPASAAHDEHRLPAVSGSDSGDQLRENERGVHIGANWDPQWHQPTDVFTTYNDKDFLLGLNAAQTTLGGVATLTGATLKKAGQ
jgi:hypothetical protein